MFFLRSLNKAFFIGHKTSGGNTTGTPPPLQIPPPPFFSARSAGKFFYLGNPQ